MYRNNLELQNTTCLITFKYSFICDNTGFFFYKKTNFKFPKDAKGAFFPLRSRRPCVARAKNNWHLDEFNSNDETVLRDSLNLKLENWWRPGFCVSSEVSKTSISAWNHRSTHFSGDMLYYFFFFRQEVKPEIRLAERIYVKSQIINRKDNTNSIWKAINRCLPKKSSGLPQFKLMIVMRTWPIVLISSFHRLEV